MQRILPTLIRTSACLVFALGIAANAADEKKVDPTGNWTWNVPGRDGTPRPTTAKLKLEGDKLTGTVSGRQGTDTAIEEAKLKGDEISFQVTREFGGTKFVSKYTGKVSGDTIKGKIATERDGQTTSADWEAKREVAKPAAP